MNLYSPVIAGATVPLASEAVLDCKASTGRLYVPEDASAVAHGDANLAIDDFLSKALL